jgi:hypothetical protein
VNVCMFANWRARRTRTPNFLIRSQSGLSAVLTSEEAGHRRTKRIDSDAVATDAFVQSDGLRNVVPTATARRRIAELESESDAAWCTSSVIGIC